MSDEGGEKKTIDHVVESFVGRLRAGEKPSIAEYQQLYPHLAEEIGLLFPSLEMLEHCRPEEENPRSKLFDADDVPADQLGDYRILREIGRGGMGIVYEADHVKMRRRVALKVLPKSFAKNPNYVERFQQEARCAGQLHHTNIVPVFEVGEVDGMHFYAMQFIRGQNLDLIIEELRAMREQSGSFGSSPEERRMRTDELKPANSPDAISDTIVMQMVVGRADAVARAQSQELAAELDDSGGRVKGNTTQDTFPGVDDLSPASPRIQRNDGGQNSSSTDSILDASGWSGRGRTRTAYFRRVAALGLQVSDALAYAHQNDLLHRDIKPANLILDTDGIVWVTDFGLAKGLDDDLTQTGDIVGTLRYMAPERFDGRTDNRSDIYSLGLTLYELCTLQIAFQNSDKATLVEQVTQQSPAPPRRVEPAIPRDLETIILKAIDRTPERRYRTARHLAEDLQAFLADRPIKARRITLPERLWRTCRRNPTTAALSFISLMLLLTVAIGATVSAIQLDRQSRELRAQNERATNHLALSEETIDKMLYRVGHDLAGVPETDGIRHGLYSEALNLQKKLLELEPGNADVALQTIGSYRRMAQIQQQIGQHDNAKKSINNLLALVETLPDQSQEKLFQRGSAHQLLSGWSRVQGDMTEAEKQSRLAIDALEQIPSAEATPEAHIALANAYRTLGAIQEQTGQLQLAELSLEKALQALDRREDTDGHGDQLTTLTDILNSLAILYRSSGRFEESEMNYRRVLDLCEKNRDVAETKLDVLDQLGISALNLGNLLMVQRRHDEAAEVYLTASETFEQLQSDFPLTIKFQRRAAQAQLSLGMIHSARDEAEEAERAYRAAIDKSKLIDAVHGATPNSQDTQAVSWNNLGNIYRDQQRLEDAIEAFEQSIAIRQPRAQSPHARPANIKSLALSMANLADTLADLEQFDRALATFESAYEVIQPLIDKYPENVSYVRVADFIAGTLSHLVADLGRYEDVTTWVDQLAVLKPNDPQHQLKATRQLERAASLARDDNALTEQQQQDILDRFASQAVELIKSALDLGWTPDNAIEQEFEWLRDCREFHELVD